MEHKPIKVSVTQKDIDSGCPIDKCGCPVALALKRALGNGQSIQVGNFAVDIDGGRAHLPLEAIAFVKAFDMGKPVKPFSFELA
jgi:hypothetical protein